MKTFLICTGLVVFLLGLALTAIPVDAQIGFPNTLTPYPTFDYVYDSPEQEQLANSLHDMVWWENAPLVVGNPRPGFVLFIIQGWQYVQDTTGQIALYTIVLGVVIFIVLRLAHRFRKFGEGRDGVSIKGSEVTQKVDSSDVEDFMRRGRR